MNKRHLSSDDWDVLLAMDDSPDDFVFPCDEPARDARDLKSEPTNETSVEELSSALGDVSDFLCGLLNEDADAPPGKLASAPRPRWR